MVPSRHRHFRTSNWRRRLRKKTKGDKRREDEGGRQTGQEERGGGRETKGTRGERKREEEEKEPKKNRYGKRNYAINSDHTSHTHSPSILLAEVLVPGEPTKGALLCLTSGVARWWPYWERDDPEA